MLLTGPQRAVICRKHPNSARRGMGWVRGRVVRMGRSWGVGMRVARVWRVQRGQRVAVRAVMGRWVARVRGSMVRWVREWGRKSVCLHRGTMRERESEGEGKGMGVTVSQGLPVRGREGSVMGAIHCEQVRVAGGGAEDGGEGGEGGKNAARRRRGSNPARMRRRGEGWALRVPSGAMWGLQEGGERGVGGVRERVTGTQRVKSH